MWRYVVFIGVPVIEILLLVWMSDRIGMLWTVVLVIVTGIIGAKMVVSQGRVVWKSFKYRLSNGAIPELEVAHGAMLIFAGAVLLTPGILTDAIGLMLLVPAIREFLRLRFMRAFQVFVR